MNADQRRFNGLVFSSAVIRVNLRPFFCLSRLSHYQFFLHTKLSLVDSFFSMLVSHSNSQVGQMFNLPVAVSDLFRLHSHAVEQCEVQVRHRRPLLVDQVPPRFEATIPTSCQQYG